MTDYSKMTSEQLVDYMWKTWYMPGTGPTNWHLYTQGLTNMRPGIEPPSPVNGEDIKT